MNIVDQHIAGAIQTDVEDVPPQGHPQAGLEKTVDVDGAVVKDLTHKGQILYIRVV